MAMRHILLFLWFLFMATFSLQASLLSHVELLDSGIDSDRAEVRIFNHNQTCQLTMSSTGEIDNQTCLVRTNANSEVFYCLGDSSLCATEDEWREVVYAKISGLDDTMLQKRAGGMTQQKNATTSKQAVPVQNPDRIPKNGFMVLLGFLALIFMSMAEKREVIQKQPIQPDTYPSNTKEKT
jgi:hypothetical protein